MYVRNCLWLLVPVILLALLTACGETPNLIATSPIPTPTPDYPRLILGKWQKVAGGKSPIESFAFYKDGTVVAVIGVIGLPVQRTGSYRFLDDRNIRLDDIVPGNPIIYEIHISDRLVIKDKDGITEYVRAK